MQPCTSCARAQDQDIARIPTLASGSSCTTVCPRSETFARTRNTGGPHAKCAVGLWDLSSCSSLSLSRARLSCAWASGPSAVDAQRQALDTRVRARTGDVLTRRRPATPSAERRRLVAILHRHRVAHRLEHLRAAREPPLEHLLALQARPKLEGERLARLWRHIVQRLPLARLL